MHGKLLRYALDADGKLKFISDVANGLACHCICPYCLEQLEAKNGGTIRISHFAHKKGNKCEKAYETALHLLAKEIIKEEKMIMCPPYKGLDIPLTKQCIFQSVEVEERNDVTSIQPDCVGVTEDGIRVHIEIHVTNPVNDEKKEKLKKAGINCMEIDIPRDFSDDKEILKDFLLKEQNNRRWIYFPYGEQKCVERKDERDKKIISNYRDKHPETIAIKTEKCENCKLFREKIKESYSNLRLMYKDRLLSWAIPISEMSLDEIIKRDICMQFSSGIKNAPFVEYNGTRHYIFPKDRNTIDKKQDVLCKSTYGFIKTMHVMAQMCKNSEFYHDQCYFLKKEWEYKGEYYTFCLRDKNVKIPIEYWRNIVLIDDLFMPLEELKDRQKRMEFVESLTKNR